MESRPWPYMAVVSPTFQRGDSTENAEHRVPRIAARRMFTRRAASSIQALDDNNTAIRQLLKRLRLSMLLFGCAAVALAMASSPGGVAENAAWRIATTNTSSHKPAAAFDATSTFDATTTRHSPSGGREYPARRMVVDLPPGAEADAAAPRLLRRRLPLVVPQPDVRDCGAWNSTAGRQTSVEPMALSSLTRASLPLAGSFTCNSEPCTARASCCPPEPQPLAARPSLALVSLAVGELCMPHLSSTAYSHQSPPVDAFCPSSSQPSPAASVFATAYTYSSPLWLGRAVSGCPCHASTRCCLNLSASGVAAGGRDLFSIPICCCHSFDFQSKSCAIHASCYPPEPQPLAACPSHALVSLAAREPRMPHLVSAVHPPYQPPPVETCSPSFQRTSAGDIIITPAGIRIRIRPSQHGRVDLCGDLRGCQCRACDACYLSTSSLLSIATGGRVGTPLSEVETPLSECCCCPDAGAADSQPAALSSLSAELEPLQPRESFKLGACCTHAACTCAESSLAACTLDAYACPLGVAACSLDVCPLDARPLDACSLLEPLQPRESCKLGACRTHVAYTCAESSLATRALDACPLGVAACSLDVCPLDARPLATCSSAACPLAAYSLDACSLDMRLSVESSLAACKLVACSLDVYPLGARPLDACSSTACPLAAYSLDACSLDVCSLVACSLAACSLGMCPLDERSVDGCSLAARLLAACSPDVYSLNARNADAAPIAASSAALLGSYLLPDTYVANAAWIATPLVATFGSYPLVGTWLPGAWLAGNTCLPNAWLPGTGSLVCPLVCPTLGGYKPLGHGAPGYACWSMARSPDARSLSSAYSHGAGAHSFDAHSPSFAYSHGACAHSTGAYSLDYACLPGHGGYKCSPRACSLGCACSHGTLEVQPLGASSFGYARLPASYECPLTCAWTADACSLGACLLDTHPSDVHPTWPSDIDACSFGVRLLGYACPLKAWPPNACFAVVNSHIVRPSEVWPCDVCLRPEFDMYLLHRRPHACEAPDVRSVNHESLFGVCKCVRNTGLLLSLLRMHALAAYNSNTWTLPPPILWLLDIAQLRFCPPLGRTGPAAHTHAEAYTRRLSATAAGERLYLAAASTALSPAALAAPVTLLADYDSLAACHAAPYQAPPNTPSSEGVPFALVAALVLCHEGEPTTPSAQTITLSPAHVDGQSNAVTVTDANLLRCDDASLPAICDVRAYCICLCVHARAALSQQEGALHSRCSHTLVYAARSSLCANLATPSPPGSTGAGPVPCLSATHTLNAQLRVPNSLAMSTAYGTLNACSALAWLSALVIGLWLWSRHISYDFRSSLNAPEPTAAMPLRLVTLLILTTTAAASPLDSPPIDDDARWVQLVELAMALATTHGAVGVAVRVFDALLGRHRRTRLRRMLGCSGRASSPSRRAPSSSAPHVPGQDASPERSQMGAPALVGGCDQEGALAPVAPSASLSASAPSSASTSHGHAVCRHRRRRPPSPPCREGAPAPAAPNACEEMPPRRPTLSTIASTSDPLPPADGLAGSRTLVPRPFWAWCRAGSPRASDAASILQRRFRAQHGLTVDATVGTPSPQVCPSPPTCPSPLPPLESTPLVPELVITRLIVRAELAAASELMHAPISQADLSGRQTLRTVLHARRREACCLAWVMFCHVPRHMWIALSFCYRLRSRAMASALERAAARRAMEARHAYVLELRAAPPRPLTAFDVGVAPDGTLLYRCGRGIVGSDHPARSPSELIVPGSALQSDGSLGSPLQPPADSPLDLCPDESGAICYVNRANGSAQWDAPCGSTALVPRALLARSLRPLPMFPPGLGFASLHGTQWHPLYSDHQGRVCLYHAETGAIREAPWICMRVPCGNVYYVNLVTAETRWFPPHRWMEGWISRPRYTPDDECSLRDSVFDGHRLSQQLLPLVLARQRTECGAPPYLYERGMPQYEPDGDDTPDTHPLVRQAIACAG